MRFQKRNVSVKYLKKYLTKLEPLINAKRKDRKNLLATDKDLIKYVCQGVTNILHGKIPINTETKHKLKRFRNKLHDLCDSNHSLDKKIQILNQTGGLPAALIPAIITGISTLISIL